MLTIASGGTSRTYDYYLDAVAGQGVLNPYYGGADQSGSIALGGLAALPGSFLTATTPQYYSSGANAIHITMANGGAITMDPALMGQITHSASVTTSSNAATWPTPPAALLGRSTVLGTFTELYSPISGTTPPSLQTIAANDVAFGWAGADSAAITYSAINGSWPVISATNKIEAGDIASVTVYSGTVIDSGAIVLQQHERRR